MKKSKEPKEPPPPRNYIGRGKQVSKAAKSATGKRRSWTGK